MLGSQQGFGALPPGKQQAATSSKQDKLPGLSLSLLGKTVIVQEREVGRRRFLCSATRKMDLSWLARATQAG